MILKSFQVRKYKNVNDSGEVKLQDGVTCLVGKNESGKSALLQALYRLNPISTGHPETFVALRDYPRRHYAQDRERVATALPVTATFELDDEDVRAVEGMHGPGVLASRRVTAARRYDGELLLEIDCNEKRLFELAAEAAGPDRAGPEHALGHEAGHEAGHESGQDADAREDPVDAREDPEDPGATYRHSAARPENRYFVPGARSGSSQPAGIRRTIEARLPKLLYFDEGSVMSGRVSIHRLQSGDEAALDPDECTTVSLLRLANVDLADFAREEYEARRASLEAVASQLTRDVFAYWSQDRELSVELDIDFNRSDSGAGQGPFIEMRVRNHRHGVTLNFNERSRGFTWFFSLLAKLSELRDSKRMILLLDEPGLSLHASAQRDLLRFIHERLAPHHQVLYSTHSPFLVAATDLEGVRTVEDRDGEGTRVSHEFFDHSNDTRLPLQAALGQEVIRSVPAGPSTLFVEEPSDHVFLTAMSGHLERLGRSCLDPRWSIVSVGRLAGVSAFIALLGVGRNLAVVAGRSNRNGAAAAELPLTRRLLAEKGVVRLAEFAVGAAAGAAAGNGRGDGMDGDLAGGLGAGLDDDLGAGWEAAASHRGMGADLGDETGRGGTGADPEDAMGGGGLEAGFGAEMGDDEEDWEDETGDEPGHAFGHEFGGEMEDEIDIVAREVGVRAGEVDDRVDLDEVDIEDLFTTDFYVDLVNRSGAATIEPFEVRGPGRIVRRIETATGLGLDRYLPARLLLDNEADPLARLDSGTFDRFERLFRKINSFIE